jgi:hypothetical protein
MGLDQYILKKFLVPNPGKLSSEAKRKLIEIFEEHGKTQLPSIISQLKNNNPIRRAIDHAFLEALEIEGDNEKLLDSTYLTILKTIETLATLMKEGKAEN